jgi:ankyrin repeat protein
MNSLLETLGPLGPVVVEQGVKYISKKAVSQSSELSNEVATNNLKAAKARLLKKPNIDRKQALVTAATHGNISALEILLEKPASQSHRHHRESDEESDDGEKTFMEAQVNSWAQGTTPLIAAIKNKHVKTAKFLLDAGADPDLYAQNGITALQVAAKEGESGLVRLLLDRGAEIDHRDACGDTALIIACRFAHSHTAKRLIDKGADVNAKNGKGGTPLLVSAKHDCINVLEMLLKEGADIRATDKKGLSVLHRAVQGVWFIEGVPVKEKEEMLRMLLREGADPTLRDNHGKTAAQRAGWLSGGESLRILLERAEVRTRERERREHAGDYKRTRTF